MEHPVSREEFNRLYAQINGNGQPGIRQNIEDINSNIAAMRGAQDERKKIDNSRWRWQAFIMSALTLLVGILGLLLANYQAHHGDLMWPNIPHKTLSEPKEKVYALKHEPQDAGGVMTPNY